MAPAWLDSLSEDWPSQAGSEPSHSPTQSPKSKASNTAPSSRINSGRLFSSVRYGQDQSPDDSSNILNERSVNEVNIFGSRHSPSKLSHEYKFDDIQEIQSRARHASVCSITTSSGGSVIHNTIERRPQTASGEKKPGDTPEWRRRIIEGQLAYGEQRDLFSSARTGLENIFNPPPAGAERKLSAAIEEEEEEKIEGGVDQELEHADDGEGSLEFEPRGVRNMANDMAMPSSPPLHFSRFDSSGFQDDEAAQQLPQRLYGNYLDTLEEESSVFEAERSGLDAEDVQAELLPESDDAAFEEDGSVHRHNVDSSHSPQPHSEASPASFEDSEIHHALGRESRVISGQSVLRNESFSAILISPEKDKGGDGAVFGRVVLPSGELKRRLENLRWNQMVLADDAAQGPIESSESIGGRSINVDCTEEYEKRGGFINFRRGGRSADGSFRDRLLSPPTGLGNDSSAMFTEESLQASTPKQFPSIRVLSAGQTDSEHSPPLPRVPNPSPEKRGTLSRQLLSASTSPLKLFGPYDTFTNQTLMRRISQYEDQTSNGSQVSAHRSTTPVDEVESKLDIPGVPAKTASTTRHPQSESHQSSTHFGAGHFDEYQFEDEQISHLPQDDPSEGDTADPRFPEPESLLSRSEALFPSLKSSLKPGELNIQRMRQSRNAMSSRPSTADKWAEPSDMAASAGRIPHLATPRRGADFGPEGKRPRTSPAKDPTPKRRRTLHKSDIAFGVESNSQVHIDSVQMSHNNMQSVIGRKRRDAREGDKVQHADPEVLARRHILTPHTPTGSRRSSLQYEYQANETVNDSAPANTRSFGSGASDERYSAAWSEGSDGSPSGLARPVSGPAADGGRKPSIRTEDFMNEAQKILAMIRSRGTGGLESVEESEMETPVVAEQSDDDDHSFQSTAEPFSRPPSREGKPVPRAVRVQEDPELVARLKKYEERSDLDDIMTTTTRSINIAQSAIRAEKEAAEAVQASLGTLLSRTRLDASDEISDPPNIRITMNPGHHDENFGASENPSQRSMSSGHSSIPTGSSRGSESRKTIAPQNVSHLIPDQVGNMVLDRDRNIWIKRRNGSSDAAPNIQPVHSILSSEGSEEDPFADIPDLSVDATMEFHRLKPPMPSPAKANGPVLFTKPSHPIPRATVEDASSFFAESTVAANEPTNRDDEENKDENADDSTAPIEHEFSINEGRVAQSSSPSKRHIAISFSSPIASIIQDFVVEDDGSKSRLDLSPKTAPPNSSAPTPLSLSRGRRTVSVKFTSTPAGAAVASEGSGGGSGSASGSARPRSVSRGSRRSFSLAGQAFVPRPISRIEEQEEDDSKNQSQARCSQPVQSQELSLLGDRSELMPAEHDEYHGEVSELMPQRQANVSVLLTTPGPASRMMDDDQLMAQYVGMLSLSPMSEFTIHQDKSLAFEASYVLGDRHAATGNNSKAVMSQNLRDLVDRIAEVQPFEPYWEDMQELDVQGKKLESLHKLNEFCPHLVTLDAAGNELRNLGGIPTSVRHLRIVGNQLSELTSWMRLANLQYLDISNNDIKTLSGLTNLVHLRSLKADNCNLENLNGVKYHDALQTLRARGNHIESLDFNGTRLTKLVELDLEGNKIGTAANLDQLVSLSSLSLRRNALAKFTPDTIHNGSALARLRTLDVSDNQLTALDVRGLPSLRVLFADRNRLARIRGFSKTPRLDSVSLREQTLSDPTERMDISSLYHAYEIRKLYLSGNVLESFDPPVDFLNLQLLELANCGLTRLPPQLGRAVPNLRKINLNFNALADLSPLCGIARLKKVLVAGNRLAHAFSLIQTLSTFVYLTEVDLRDNPVTQGFYPPAQASLSTGKEVGSKRRASKDKGMGEQDAQEEDSQAAQPTTEPFTLPLADSAQDKAYCSRLDMATGMRRRVYSQVFGDACSKLERLDGLAVDRALGEVRDAVWQALTAKGIVISAWRKADSEEEKREKRDDSG